MTDTTVVLVKFPHMANCNLFIVGEYLRHYYNRNNYKSICIKIKLGSHSHI